MKSQFDLSRFYDVIIRNSLFKLGFLTREFQIPVTISYFYLMKFIWSLSLLKPFPLENEGFGITSKLFI